MLRRRRGAQTLAVDSPADDPNITGVGGTSLFNAGNEPVWNDCEGEPDLATCQTDTANSEGAGGGGLSAYFTRPAWQPVAAQGTCSLASCRQVPDVSANAGVGEIFKSANAWYAVGGTSIAAPKIAAIVADVDTACTAPVGDLAPKLTALAANNGYGTALTDVTVGDNDLTRNQGGDFAAMVGADLASGLGTPIASGWSCPQITSMSTTQAAAGTPVTITGFGLANATIRFGNTVAAVTAGPTATSVTVTIPAGAGTVAVRGTNAIGTGTHTVNFSYPGVVTTTTTTTVPKPPPPPPKPLPVNTRAYRTVASDGGIFTFGGAVFRGSTGAIKLNQPIVGMTTDEATGGYWFVARDGGIFGFDAPFFGSAGGIPLAAPVVGMAGTTDGKGYWLITANGIVFSYGDAHNFGSVAHPSASIVGMASTPDGNGYWLAGRDGSIYPFGDAHNFGSMSGTQAHATDRRHRRRRRDRWLLVGRDRRRHLRVRRAVLRLDRRHQSQPADRRHRRDPQREGLLDGRPRRRDLHLRQRAVLGLDGRYQAQPADGRDGRRGSSAPPGACARPSDSIARSGGVAEWHRQRSAKPFTRVRFPPPPPYRPAYSIGAPAPMCRACPRVPSRTWPISGSDRYHRRFDRISRGAMH